MIRIRPSAARGRTRLDWLDSRHSFSFNEYRDPAHDGFRSLLVLNDDRVAPGAGFGMHGHRDSEILSYVVAGSLEHRDSLGAAAVLPAGGVQTMSAGTGIRHSEFNPSRDAPCRFLQVWLRPDRRGLPPRHGQRDFPAAERRGRWRRVAAPAGAGPAPDGALPLHLDARVFATLLDGPEALTHPLAPGRAGWIQIVRGRVRLSGHVLGEGDGAAVEGEGALTVEALEATEALLFDLP